MKREVELMTHESDMEGDVHNLCLSETERAPRHGTFNDKSKKVPGKLNKLAILPLSSSGIELVEELTHSIIHYNLGTFLVLSLLTSCDFRDLLWASLTLFFSLNYLH